MILFSSLRIAYESCRIYLHNKFISNNGFSNIIFTPENKWKPTSDSLLQNIRPREFYTEDWCNIHFNWPIVAKQQYRWLKDSCHQRPRQAVIIIL